VGRRVEQCRHLREHKKLKKLVVYIHSSMLPLVFWLQTPVASLDFTSLSIAEKDLGRAEAAAKSHPLTTVGLANAHACPLDTPPEHSSLSVTLRRPAPAPAPASASASASASAEADLPESNAAVLRPVAQARCVLYADQLDRLALERRVHCKVLQSRHIERSEDRTAGTPLCTFAVTLRKASQ
jgi:hypothetical protein